MAMRGVSMIVLAAWAALGGGCLQIDIAIKMHENGTAAITERTRFSATLLALDQHVPGARLEPMLERKAIERRMRQMGKGVRLVSHKLTTLKDGARESVAVFEIPNIEDLRLVNPYLHQAAPGRLMRFRFVPIYRLVHSFHKVGDLMMYLVPAERPKPRGKADEKPPPEPSRARWCLGNWGQ